MWGHLQMKLKAELHFDYVSTNSAASNLTRQPPSAFTEIKAVDVRSNKIPIFLMLIRKNVKSAPRCIKTLRLCGGSRFSRLDN